MDNLVIYLLKSAGILALFYIAYKILLQKETFFTVNRHYLLAGILASLLLPFVVFTSYIYVDPMPVSELAYSEIPYSFNAVATTEEASSLDWNSLIFNIYILGVVLVGTQFIMQLISLLKIIRSGTLKTLGAFKLVEVTQDVSPFSFFNYIIYNPKSFSETDLDIIINHEKAHGKQLHSLDILLAQLLVVFQWFNPFVWLYKKNIQQNLEFMADKSAVTSMSSKQHYQRTLLKVSVAPYCTSITNNFYNSLIKKRIVMLNQSSSKTHKLWKYSLILPALALFLMSFNTKTIEVVKETEITLNDPFSDPVFEAFETQSHSDDPVEKVIPLSLAPEKEINKLPASQDNEVLVKITKNTSKEELDQMEKDLKDKGMDFSYSNVNFNAKGEITSIKIKYKDTSSGNSGSYHVDGDEGEPINDIFIYKTEGGGIGLGNSPDGKAHKMRMKEHKERAYAHQLRMKEHTEEIREEHEERMEEHQERMKEHQARMEEEREVRIEHMKERREEMHKEREKHIEHMEKRRAEMKEEHKERMKEHKERSKERKERIRRLHKGDSLVWIEDDNQSNTFVYKSSSDRPSRIRMKKGEDVIYFVDGKETDKKIVKGIDVDRIATIDVLKGDSAIKVYGDKGKDGVVKIITKSGGKNSDHNTFVYEDVHFGSSHDNASGSTYSIDKTTTDSRLKSIKAKLKSHNVTAKFAKIKRDKSGNITRIKVELSDANGNKSSSTYNTSPDGIPKIRVGKKGSKLIVSSRG